MLRGRGFVERANYITGSALTGNGLTAFSKEFPTGEGWWALFLRFNLALTVGTGTTPIAEGELSIIKNIQLRTGAGELICNLPGRALYKIAHYKNRAAPVKDAIAAATATYRVILPIYFTDQDLIRPVDTMLNTARYNSMSLQVQMGGVADLLGTVGTSSVILTMDAEIERTYQAFPANVKQVAHINYDFRAPVDASVTQQIDLERGSDLAVKRYYVHSGTGGTAGVPFSGANSDAVQNIINLRDQGHFIEKDRIHGMIQNQNSLDRELTANIVGLEVFDFVGKDRSLSSAYSTVGKSNLEYRWTNQAGVGAGAIVTIAHEGIRSLKAVR